MKRFQVYVKLGLLRCKGRLVVEAENAEAAKASVEARIDDDEDPFDDVEIETDDAYGDLDVVGEPVEL